MITNRTAFAVLLIYVFILGLRPCNALIITVDPGHSYSKPGAISCSGVGEVYFNDALAARVVTALQKAGHTVRLTRTGKEAPTLIQRAATAKGSDLLLSIHHDSVQPQFLSHKAGLDGKDHLCTYHAKGYSIFISQKNAHLDQSKAIATRIAMNLQSAGFTPSLHHAEDVPGERRELFDASLGIYYFDDLIVLKSAQIPAVLVEANVIVNPEDEQESVKKPVMDAFSSAIVKAVVQ